MRLVTEDSVCLLSAKFAQTNKTGLIEIPSILGTPGPSLLKKLKRGIITFETKS
jgi:hypothetical protein